MENVGMLVHRGLREVLGSLAEIGYDAEWQDIRASDVGAPHRRERIWIISLPVQHGRGHALATASGEACNNEKSDRADEERQRDAEQFGIIETCSDIPDTAGCIEAIPHPSHQLSHGTGDARGRRGEFTDGGDVADAATAGLERQKPARGRSGKPGLSAECGNEFPDAINNGSYRPERNEAKQGSDGTKNGLFVGGNTWSVEPDVGRLVNGLSGRVDRLKGLGNAIVPQIAELLFGQIKQFIQE